MPRVLVLMLALVCVSSVPVFAQAPTYELKIYAVGATSPQQSYPLGGVQCNQPPPTVVSNVNPSRVAWDDPANAGRKCIFTEGPLGPIFSRPVGDYEGTVTVTTDAGTSLESARAPFFVKARPAVLTGVQFSR